jgi:hypothetical protein
MKIIIDIEAITTDAKDDYREDEQADLADAPMTDIHDYSSNAVQSYLDNLMAELQQSLTDIIEQEVQTS